MFRHATLKALVSSFKADGFSDENGAIFPAVLVLKQLYLKVKRQTLRLMLGMNLKAEIKTGERPVFDYLLSPVWSEVDESLKER